MFPEFSNKYLLRGGDESKIRDLFTPRVVRFFESNEKLCVEAQNNMLIFYKSSKRAKAKNIEAFLDEGQRVHQVFTTGWLS